MKPEEYLTLPYSRVIIPDSETGTFTGKVLEFPGCVTEGDTISETYELLEDAALSWIEAALELGQEVPPPASDHVYGGKIALRIPRSLHKEVALAAQRDGTSINQYIMMVLSEKVGTRKSFDDLVNKFILVTASNRGIGWELELGKTQSTAATPTGPCFPLLSYVKEERPNARN